MASEPPNTSSNSAEPKKSSLVKKILIALLVLVALLLVVVAMQPSEFRVASATIDAPPPAVFDKVNDFHNWEGWSPWAKLDPTMKTTYEGEETGKGAVYSWSGNNEVGEGRMTIVESRPSEMIKIKLEFLKPFAATNETVFTFTPQGDDKTDVEWAMEGKNSFTMKAMHLVMNMDKLLGGDFDKGLTNMKAQVEGQPKP